MSATTSYACDRCREQIRYTSYLQVLTIDRGDQHSSGKPYTADLCPDCANEIKAFIMYNSERVPG